MRREYLVALCLAATASLSARPAAAQWCGGTPPIVSVRIVVEKPDLPLQEPITISILPVGTVIPIKQVMDSSGQATVELKAGQYKIWSAMNRQLLGSQVKFLTVEPTRTERIVHLKLQSMIGDGKILVPSNPVPLKISVIDPAGSPIANAALNFTSEDDVWVMTGTTDKGGEFVAQLDPGDYKVNLPVPGFFPETRIVRVQKFEGGQQIVRFTPRVGVGGPCVDVTPEKPPISMAPVSGEQSLIPPN